ncbi:hypothetical protein [Phormidium sp. CCY1219]|uniref:hypothetical protein n=1 Tax=Phormidium sp. CCY1219 TaxID=2886104 RepID=UPI002D1F3A3D|nr:hypothetical protein [Phormidium sp. CCY1219]MEB3829078.1 hypothetical protein [Phormidium sp. CCY1219]
MSDREFQALSTQRNANRAIVLGQIIESEWYRILRELDGLDVDAGEVAKAARLIGQYEILDKLMAALSEGSLASDYEIEAQWRSELIERVVEAFELNAKTTSEPRRYRSLAQQVAEACGLEAIEE